jgi:hypothetical protein
MIKKIGLLVFVLALGVILTACSKGSSILPQTGGTQTPQSFSDLPAAAQAVLTQLSTQLNVPLDQIQVIEITPIQWPDSCLGLGKPNESCLQVITNGFKVVARVGNQEYEFHTDQTGASIRQK